MKYIQLIDQARAHGVATEKKMMEAMEQLSCDLASLEETNPELYWCILRHQHAVFYDRHYSEKWPIMMSAILCTARKVRMVS